METVVEGEYGHGALPLKRDLRDHKYRKLAMASQPFDWTVGYDAEKSPTPSKDQGSSSSCGGQSAAYLEALTRPLFSERSAKYVYSQIFYPPGGTTLRDIFKFLVKSGAAAEAAVPSYRNGIAPDETFMRDRSHNDAAAASALEYIAAGYAFVDPDIESYAQAIRDNGGAIMQVNGQNNGTWLSAQPVPPPRGAKKPWSHFMVCTGAMMRNGVKVIKVHNSWGDKTGEKGYQYISEDYFKTGNILMGGTIYSKEDPLIVQQKITLITKLIAACQQLINLLTK